MSKVEKYLAEIRNAAGGKPCIFRGQANKDWKLESGVERRIRFALGDSDEPIPIDHIVSNQEKLLNDARKRGFGLQDGRELHDLELLAELQHFGAATCLLDFTNNPLVALYFACTPDNGIDGIVHVVQGTFFAVARNELAVRALIIDESYKENTDSGNREQILQWTPIMHGVAERRVLAQQGLFILNYTMSANHTREVIIPCDEKSTILDELASLYRVDASSLFQDLAGFAQNNSSTRPLNDPITSFFLGNQEFDNQEFDKEEYEKAINYYTDAINNNPRLTSAYQNRGFAYNRLGKYEAAATDFTTCIGHDPDNPDFYYYRGQARLFFFHQRQDEMGLNRDVPVDDLELLKLLKYAIMDFDFAINRIRHHLLAFEQRAMAKKGVGDLTGAVEDWENALRCGRELKVDDNRIRYIERNLKSAKLRLDENRADKK